jgi:type II secretory pathway component PulF
MTVARRFAVRGRRADGTDVVDTIRAPDRRTAILQLAQEGVTAISVTESRDRTTPFNPGGKRETEGDRLLVLQQIAILSRAGIPILEAVESIASALAGRSISSRLLEAARGLRRGERIATALKSSLPDYPAHVYALIQVGEANGNLADVLEEAVRQLKYQRALKRDIVNALSYPAFLVVAAMCALAFLFAVVVPRFAVMLGTARDDMDGLPRAVLDIGAFVNAHPVVTLTVLCALAGAAAWTVITPEGRRRSLRMASDWPIVGDQIIATQRAEWARLMALAVSTGIGILDAAALSFDATPAGPFRERLTGSIRALRRGDAVADAFGASGALDAIDMSLLRTGQRSGALGEMFVIIADRHEEAVRAGMKRFTGILEQLAIAIVATVIGTVVIGIVGAMTSIYETIG